MPKINYLKFSQNIKSQYPEYKDWNDLELAEYFVAQEPRYSQSVDFGDLKKKDQAASSLGAQGGLPSQQPSAQPRKAREERFFGGTFGNLLDALDMPTPGVPGSGLGIGDFIDDMGRAFSSGKKAGVNISTSRPLFFSGPGSSDEEVQNFVKAGTEYTGPSDEATQFYKDYEDNGKTTFGFVKALAKNPGVAPELVVQSASQFLFNPEARAAFGASIAAGAGIGALASAPLGGIGAAPGAIAAILPGVAAANTAVSTLSSFSELMKQELDQRGLEFNEDNVRTILEDEKALRKIRAKSAGYGITIGAFDLATAKVGGAIAAKIPMTTRAGKIKSTLATTGAEAVGGSAGEAAARGVTGQELDPAEIGLEGIAEIPGAAPTLLSQVLKRPTYKINGEFVGQADVDDILQNSSRQELENTKFEVFNDVNMYGSKFRNRLEDLGLLEEITEANPNASEADINRLFELNSKLKKVENLNSESAKASADWLRSQIREVQDGLLTQEFAPQEVQQVEEAASEAAQVDPAGLSPMEKMEAVMAEITANFDEFNRKNAEPQTTTEQTTQEATQMAPAEVSPEVGMEIPQEDQGVLQVINSVVQPISSDIEARMNNAEEIPMSEIEAVVDALIDAQQSVRSQEGARTRQTQGGFVTEFGALSEDQKRNFDTLIEQQINKLLNYEFATITTTEQAGEKTKTAGLVATPREGRPLPESVVSRDRFDGAGVRVGGRGAGRITVKRIPGFGGRSVYGVSFGNRKGVTPVEDLEFDNLEFVAPEVLGDGSLNVRVRDSKSGLEFTITDPELSIDLAIAAQLKEAGRKEFPQPAFLEAVREVTQGQPTQVTTFPNLGRTGTTPAAVGVEPQTEQDVRQETNAPQEGRAQGENAAPVPQEEGRQEGQVTPPAVAQEGETPPAAKRTRKTEQQKADERNAAAEELKKTLRALRVKPGGGANIDLTFGVVPISKAVWNTAIDTAILAIDAGQSIAQAVKAASDYISSKIDGDWGKTKFEQYMDERFGQAPLNQQIDDVAESAGISPKNFRDLYRVNRELFGLNQSEAMSAAIAMDKMIDVMAKRAGVSKTEMYGRLNFKKATEQDLPQGAIKQDKEEILRVFHGTSKDKDFKKFKDTGKGVFVTISPKEASEYAEQNDSMKFGDYDPVTRKFREINTASRVIPMNLKLGNSYKLTKADLEFLNSKPNYSALQKELHARIKADGFDTIDYGNGVYAVLTEGRLRSMLTNEVLFQLIGENAELSQEVRNNLQTARVMEAAGESVKSIRLRTGWERGKDGKWRYEIDDSSVSLMFNMKSMSQLGKKYNLDSVLNYPELFSAYPELRKVKISISKKGGSTNEAFFDGKQIVLGIGTYDLSSYIEKLQRKEFLRNIPADILKVVNAYLETEQLFDELRKQGFSFDEALDAKMKKSPFNEEVDKMLLESGYGEANNLFGREFITPNQKFFEIVRAIEAAKKEEDRPSEFNLDLNKDLLLTTLHEIQHWIQKKEGFARGGNMVLAYEQLSAGEKSIYDDLQKKSKEKLDELDSKSLKWYEQGDDIRDIVLAPQNFLNEAYRKIAGEVEARNVEGRFGMTPEQRRATTLQETEDVARDEQMVLFEKAVPQGVKFQVDAWHGSPYQFDKFTTDRIGTGEGAQAFGWGLYFTDLKSIAETYAKNLSKRRYSKFLFNGKPVSDSIGNILDYFDYTGFDVNLKNIKQSLIDFITEEIQEDPAQEQRYRDEIDFIRKANVTENKSKGVVYKASINKGKASDQYTWLEWDKPINPEVKKKILDFIERDKKYGGNVAEGFVNTWKEAKRSIKYRLENNLYSDGQSLYEDIAETSGLSPKSASLFLLDAGIDGNKYPAESIARGATSDTARGFNYVVFDENAVSIEEVIKFQKDAVKARGAMMITLDGQATIYALTDPNVSTPLHELAHVFEHYLTDEEKATVQEWAKTEDWTIKTSEAFARGFEKYLAEGKAPTPALQKIFDNFKQWLTDIYRGIVGSDIDIELNKPMRDLYAKMFEFTGEDGKPQQQAQPEAQVVTDGTAKERRDKFFDEIEGMYRAFPFQPGFIVSETPNKNVPLKDVKILGRLSVYEGSNDSSLYIDEVQAQNFGERTGNGSKIMQIVSDMADKYGLTIELVASPISGNNMTGVGRAIAKALNTPEKLAKFYEKFGFVNVADNLGREEYSRITKELRSAGFSTVNPVIPPSRQLLMVRPPKTQQQAQTEAKPEVVKQGSRAFLESVKSAFPKRGMLGGVVITDADGTELAEASFEIKDDENIGGISNEIPKIELSSFLSLKAGSRQGFGKRALAVIKDMADKHGVQIILVPDPLRFLNIKGVNKKFLERFYGKSGFKSPHRLSPYMVYLPQTPEAKPEKNIADQRKEFRETAKKYFDGLKKMGIAFDPEGNSKEDIAFLKALAKYIKLELDAGMVTFKGFLEKTANLIEGFNEKAVVAAAKEAWAKEVVKAYPKLYAKYNAAKRKELEREIKDIRKTMIRRIMDMTEPKIVNFKSQLKTEKRRLSKEAAAQLAAIRNAYDAKTMMAMEPQDLMELLNLTEGIYKEGRSEIKALNESLDEAAQIQGEQMLEAISSKNKRLDKLESKEVARRKLANKAGIVVAIKGDDRIIMKEEKDLEALDGEGYTFLFLNTISDKAIEGNLFQNIARFFSENVRSLRENARDLRTGLELIKSGNKQSQDFINGLVEKMNKASVEKARKEQSWSKLLKEQRKAFFGSDLNFRYTNWMQGVPKMNGKPMVLRNGGNEKIGGINNAKIVTLFRQMMDPTNLVKTKGVRKIDLSDESIRQIIDYMNLPENKAGKGFALSLNGFFEKVAMDTAATLEENGYNAKKLEPKRYNKEDFADDTFIGDIMNQLSETRTEGFIPYTPIQATESPDTVQGAQINEDDLLNPGDVQKNFSVISNNMITRKPGGVIVPTDIRQALNSYTAGMANMNAKLPILRDTQVIFSKKNLTAMSNAFAPQFAENLKSNYISFMTDRVTPVSSSKSSAAFKTWLMTSTAIPMFFNPKSALLQFLAVPNFMVSYDITRYFSASKKLISDPVLFKDLAVQIINLPTMRQRFGGRFSPDSRVVNEEMKRYGNLAITLPLTNLKISAKELLAKGYLPSSIGDIGTIAIGGAPVYYDILQRNKAKYLAQGMSEDQASARAKSDAEEKLFEIIQETQQSSEAMYLSEFQKQSFTRLFTSFATATQQYYRKARRAAARMKNKEGNQLQNAYEILHYTAINAALFQFFSSMLMDAISGPGEDELEEMSRQERMDLVRYMESIMETVAQGTGGIGVALQAIILASKEMAKSGKPEKVLESVLRTMPAARIKYDAGLNALREWKRGDYVRAFTKGGEVANIPTDRIRALVVQVSEALTENLEAQERIARITSFRTESWMREKREREIWNGVQSAVDKSTPAERQRAISNTKSAYRDLFQLYGKRYAEATTEAEKARVDSIASKELLNVYNHRQGGPEFTEELQKLFNQSAEFNSLPKDMQKLKNMETNRKIGDVVEEVLSLEKKSEQKAMEYWSSLVNNGILSKNEIERVREEYNTRKGLQ